MRMLSFPLSPFTYGISWHHAFPGIWDLVHGGCFLVFLLEVNVLLRNYLAENPFFFFIDFPSQSLYYAQIASAWGSWSIWPRIQWKTEMLLLAASHTWSQFLRVDSLLLLWLSSTLLTSRSQVKLIPQGSYVTNGVRRSTKIGILSIQPLNPSNNKS